jgi:hypothetical protein
MGHGLRASRRWSPERVRAAAAVAPAPGSDSLQRRCRRAEAEMLGADVAVAERARVCAPTPNPATQLMHRLDVEPAAISESLQCWLGAGTPAIDPAALETLGIDYDRVVGRLEQTFGAGALEHPHRRPRHMPPRQTCARLRRRPRRGQQPPRRPPAARHTPPLRQRRLPRPRTARHYVRGRERAMESDG